MTYDIEVLKRKMLVKYPFFGSVVSNVKYKETEDVQTAGTDGKVIYYNPKFLESLSVEEQTFIFAHEVCHIAFNHILRSQGKNQKLWNIATDGVINQFLKRDGLKMVEGGVNIEEAINYDAEQLYEILLKEQEEKEDQQNGNDSEQQNNQQSQSDSQEEEENQDVGHDTHSMWSDAVNKSEKEQEETKDQEEMKEQEETKEQEEIKKKQEELEKYGEKFGFDKNSEEKKRKLDELRKSISKNASQAGNKSNGDIREIRDIGISKPIVDWRYLLREAIKYDVDWSYGSSTIEDGVITPHLEEQPMPETEIVLDTSGSIDEDLLRSFLRECKNILKHSKLKVGCFDTNFYGFTEIRTEQDIEDMQFEGGGGTDFDAAIGAFSNRVENKIIFTDGMAETPQLPFDGIWLVFGEKKYIPDLSGKVIIITPEQLDELYSRGGNSRRSSW